MKYILAVLPFVWFGMIGAISFIEAPIKFRAPNITRELGLGIGKLVFRALNRIELVFAAIIAAALIAQGQISGPAWVFSAAIAILLLQTLWLLPALNARAEAVIKGEKVGGSRLHLVFVALEITKMILLAVGGICFLVSSGL